MVSRPVSYLAAGAIAIGILALITVVSVMNGFLRETRSIVRGTTADVIVLPVQDPGSGPVVDRAAIERVVDGRARRGRRDLAAGAARGGQGARRGGPRAQRRNRGQQPQPGRRAGRRPGGGVARHGLRGLPAESGPAGPAPPRRAARTRGPDGDAGAAAARAGSVARLPVRQEAHPRPAPRQLGCALDPDRRTARRGPGPAARRCARAGHAAGRRGPLVHQRGLAHADLHRGRLLPAPASTTSTSRTSS